ncbi:MAG: sigma 54-interacting transcriptional regulator, partial [Deltaproteobacteria bacterium]
EMKKIVRTALKLAHMDASNIMILGESGTGKGLLAKFIHKNSKRANKPFIQINCASLPENILEAELFGYEKGAFTGAKMEGKPGLIELSNQGTLFLDEIGEMSSGIQAKLLKYLDDHEVRRLGSVRTRKIDCKILAATNQDLETLLDRKKFRKDLYYRLNAITLTMPPLRERPEDIFHLVQDSLFHYNKKYKMKKTINPLTLTILQSYDFPGNVREWNNRVT